MKFYPYGPFALEQDADRRLTFESYDRSSFWSDVDSSVAWLSEACGCYVFAIRSGGGSLPWYIGKAERQSFKRECLTADKVKKYNEALTYVGRGTPILYFYARLTVQKGAFSAPSTSKHRDVGYLERMLIGTALSRNPDLINRQETKMLREMVVPGYLNSSSGALPTAARELKAVLGIE